MKREEVCRVVDRGRTCRGWKGKEGHGVGNVLDNGRGVDNGVDRGHVGIVDDDKGLVPSLSRYP